MSQRTINNISNAPFISLKFVTPTLINWDGKVLSELFWISCAVCGRRKQTAADTIEDAWGKAEEAGWQIHRFTGTNNIEVRCPKHWVAGFARPTNQGY